MQEIESLILLWIEFLNNLNPFEMDADAKPIRGRDSQKFGQAAKER